MIPSRENMDHEPSLIEDVMMPHAERFTNPDKPVVRRRSIGNLHRQYLRMRNKNGVPLSYQATDSASDVDVKVIPRRRYSVVPPLQTLQPASDSMPGLPVASLLLLAAPIEAARFLGRKLYRAARKIGGAVLAIGSGFYLALTRRLPKRYSAAAGVAPDWRSAAWESRYVVPVVLVAFILSLLLWGLLRGNTHQPGQGAGATQIPVTQAFTVGGKGGAGGSGGGSAQQPGQSGSAASSQSPAYSAGGGSSLGYGSVPTGTASGSGGTGGTSPTGGMGGGPTGGGTPSGGGSGGGGVPSGGGGGSGGGVTIPTCSLNQVATTTCTVTACSPPVTLGPGQKAVLGVGGVCVVLN